MPNIEQSYYRMIRTLILFSFTSTSFNSPLGVYLLGGSALYTQTKTTQHLTQMAELATKSTEITLLATAELESSIELQTKSAIDSEEGLELQSESIELETDAEEEFAKAAEETILAEEYEEQASALEKQSAKDALESETAFSQAKELELNSQQLQIKADEDRVSAAINEDKSVAMMVEVAKAKQSADGAEVKVGEYEGIALKDEAKSLKEGEALVKTETGALVSECKQLCPVFHILFVTNHLCSKMPKQLLHVR